MTAAVLHPRPPWTALPGAHGELDFRSHLWPLIAKEAGYGYYRELFTGSPERVSTGWDEFSGRFAALDWYSAAREDLVAASVPDTRLHLDLERLDRPFAGRPSQAMPRCRTPWRNTSKTTSSCATGPTTPKRWPCSWRS